MTKIYQRLMPISPEIPELENGDRLDSAEFLRRYENMPEGVRAELIEGIVYMNAAAVRYRKHGVPHGLIQLLLGYYSAHTSGVECCSPSTTFLDAENTYEPDVILRLLEGHGGLSREGDDGYLHGAPELVVEIAASSARRDTHVKKDAYERLGVKECILWRTSDKQIDWFSHEDGQFDRLTAETGTIVKSRIFPGLWLDFELLTQLDGRASLKLLEEGLDSQEHTRFAETLRLKSGPSET